jgi:enoyl-CoA hydratase
VDLRCVLAERRGAVGLVVLNRPAKLNAINGQMANELVQVLDEYEADGEVRAIVLAGAGERAFSAGGDMTEVVQGLGPEARRRRNAPFWKRVRECRKPTIAAIRGYCYGGAAVLASSCDIRICGDDAKFRFVGATYGLGGGGSLLPRIVGDANAKEILFTADIVDAAEALRVGLANQVVPAAEVVDYAVAMGARMAGNSPSAVLALKQIIESALPIEDAIELETALASRNAATQDTASRFRAAAERVVGSGAL